MAFEFEMSSLMVLQSIVVRKLPFTVGVAALERLLSRMLHHLMKPELVGSGEHLLTVDTLKLWSFLPKL